MENKVSEKIRLILNELAILNQPEQTGNKIFNKHEDLLKIRSLAAELYLNSYLAMQSDNVPLPEVIPTFEPLVEETRPEHVAEAVEEIQVEETIIATEEIEITAAVEPLFEVDTPEIVSEHDPVAEPEVVVETPSEIEPEPVVAEVPVEAPPVSTSEPEVIEIPVEEPIQTELPLDGQIDTHEPSEELKEQHDFKPPRITSEQIASQISFTRRFEYINQLFGGNTELFMEFLDEMGYSNDTTHAMEIFDRHFNEKNWQRRQESAMEFKRLLQRSC